VAAGQRVERKQVQDGPRLEAIGVEQGQSHRRREARSDDVVKQRSTAHALGHVLRGERGRELGDLQRARGRRQHRRAGRHLDMQARHRLRGDVDGLVRGRLAEARRGRPVNLGQDQRGGNGIIGARVKVVQGVRPIQWVRSMNKLFQAAARQVIISAAVPVEGSGDTNVINSAGVSGLGSLELSLAGVSVRRLRTGAFIIHPRWTGTAMCVFPLKSRYSWQQVTPKRNFEKKFKSILAKMIRSAFALKNARSANEIRKTAHIAFRDLRKTAFRVHSQSPDRRDDRLNSPWRIVRCRSLTEWSE
jgi:hypothetical protein